ncbi:Uncharacterised protein [Stenotrophomonas maltophilia]|nr:Uncharacterised protein [Stenotrophomonas maltophilia]
MPQHPDHRRAAVGGEQRIVGRILRQQRGQVLRVDQLAFTRLFFLFALLQRLVATLDALVQETAVLARRQHRQQGIQRRRDITDHAQVHRVAATQMTAIAVDLDDRGLVRVELAPGEVGAEQQQRVARHQCVEAGLDAEDAGHAHVVRVVRLDEVLGARGVRDRRLQASGQFQQLRVRALATGTRVDADALALPQQLGDTLKFGVGRTQYRLGVVHRERHIVLDLGLADIGREDHHRHAAAADRRLAGQRDHAACLFGAVHLFAEHRTTGVHRLEVHFLREFHAQLAGHHLAGDQHHRRTVSVALEHAVDEVQAAGSAGAGAGGQFAAHQRIGACSERCHFFMAHVHPGDLAAMHRIGHMIERIAHDAVATADTGLLQGVHHDFGHALAHRIHPRTGERPRLDLMK